MSVGHAQQVCGTNFSYLLVCKVRLIFSTNQNFMGRLSGHLGNRLIAIKRKVYYFLVAPLARCEALIATFWWKYAFDRCNYH